MRVHKCSKFCFGRDLAGFIGAAVVHMSQVLV